MLDDAARRRRGRPGGLGRPGRGARRRRTRRRRRRPGRRPRLRRLPQPPGVRRRPRRGVRGPDDREPYTAGGIRTTVAATRAATDEQLAANLARLVAEMRGQGTTTVEVKSGYGLTVHDEARSLAIARQVTDGDDVPRRARGPAEYADDPAAYVDLVTGPMLDGCAPHARWVDVFCERGAFDEDQAEPILRPAPTAVCAGASTPTSWRPAAACSSRASSASSPSTTAPTSPTPTSTPSRDSRHDRDAAAGRRVLDPLALPRRAAAARRRGTRRARERLQPGLVLHLLDAAVHRARGPRDADEPGRGAARRDRVGAAALDRGDVGQLAPGAPPTSSCSTRRRTSTWPTAPASRSWPGSGRPGARSSTAPAEPSR